MSELKWCEPPPPKSTQWGRVAEELKARPGEWAQVAENTKPNYAYASARKQLRRLGCEVAVRQTKGRANVWARWPEAVTPNGRHKP